MVITGKSQVSGRGTIFSVKVDPEDTTPVPGAEIMYEGKQWRIVGVECSRALTYPGGKRDSTMGLIVKEVTRG